MQTVRDYLSKIENGSRHVLIYDYDTGEVLLKTIWYNLIEDDVLDADIIETINKSEYEIRIGVRKRT